MLLLIVVCGLLFIQIWGSGKPLHRDQWFYSCLNAFSKNTWIASQTLGVFGATLALTLVIALVIYIWLDTLSVWLSAAFSVLVLVYSMGRGQFSEPAKAYISAWRNKNWQSALDAAHSVDVNAHDIEQDDWGELNHQMVSTLAYRGFERVFVVLFWFAFAGIIGALTYRLIALYSDYTEDPKEEELAQQWQWYMEWPVARLFGLSLSITGNFASCFARCQQFLTCTKTRTQNLLVYFVESALNVAPTESADPRCGERELTELMQLYSRTMVLWVCVVALITLLL